MSDASQNIILFDLCGEFFRNYFGTGKSVTASYEATIERMMFYRDEYERFAVCLDARSKRYDIYPEYKANRPPHDQEAIDTLKAIEEQAQSWGTPAIRCAGYEADDVIATIVEQCWADEVRIVGGSPDKDLWSLIRDNVKLITKRGEVGVDGCVDKFGVLPGQIRDLLAIVGDASDNVPGCPGVGMVGARRLLNGLGTLAAAKAATDDELKAKGSLKGKALENFRAWDPTLALSLVTLFTDAPIKVGELWGEVAATEEAW